MNLPSYCQSPKTFLFENQAKVEWISAKKNYLSLKEYNPIKDNCQFLGFFLFLFFFFALIISIMISSLFFRWLLFQNRSHREATSNSDLDLLTWYQFKAPIWTPSSSQRWFSSSLFLPSSISGCWICLLCMFVNFLQIQSHLYNLQYRFCKYAQHVEEKEGQIIVIFNTRIYFK